MMDLIYGLEIDLDFFWTSIRLLILRWSAIGPFTPLLANHVVRSLLIIVLLLIVVTVLLLLTIVLLLTILLLRAIVLLLVTILLLLQSILLLLTMVRVIRNCDLGVVLGFTIV